MRTVSLHLHLSMRLRLLIDGEIAERVVTTASRIWA